MFVIFFVPLSTVMCWFVSILPLVGSVYDVVVLGSSDFKSVRLVIGFLQVSVDVYVLPCYWFFTGSGGCIYFGFSVYM